MVMDNNMIIIITVNNNISLLPKCIHVLLLADVLYPSPEQTAGLVAMSTCHFLSTASNSMTREGSRWSVLYAGPLWCSMESGVSSSNHCPSFRNCRID